jgi:hypothetical protein
MASKYQTFNGQPCLAPMGSLVVGLSMVWGSFYQCCLDIGFFQYQVGVVLANF